MSGHCEDCGNTLCICGAVKADSDSRLEASQKIAEQLLERFKVKNPKLYEKVLAHILLTGKEPKIKLFWDSKIEDLRFEVIE